MRREDEPITYALRLHRRARADMDDARRLIANLLDAPEGRRWQAELLETISTLATFPNRCPIARESRLFQREIRQLNHKQSYRILFTVVEAAEEAPFVFILHIRHGARRPMTRREAREIESEY